MTAGQRSDSAKMAVLHEGADLSAVALAGFARSPMMCAVVAQNGEVVLASERWLEEFTDGNHAITAICASAGDELAPHLRQWFEQVSAGEEQQIHQDIDLRSGGRRGSWSLYFTRQPESGVLVTIADVTARQTRVSELAHEASHDQLTGLPNHVRFVSEVKRVIEESEPGQEICVAFCDLDGFKQLNDEHGHSAGDEVLRQFGSRLRDLSQDPEKIARLHGDEFALVAVEANVRSLGESIVAAARTPFAVKNQRFTVSGSVGIVQTTTEAGTRDAQKAAGLILDQADSTMYAAKRAGKNRFVVRGDQVWQQDQAQRLLVGDTRSTGREGEFLLHFEPRWCSSGELAGAQAILMWDHPERGLVRPAPALARTGTIPLAMADWIVGQATAVLAFWEPWLPTEFRMGVPLSSSQWLDPDTPAVAKEWLTRSRVAPDRLLFEVDTDALVQEPTHTREAVARLAELGVSVAVSDFGRQQTPLTDYAELPVQAAVLTPRMLWGTNTAALSASLNFMQQLGWEAIVTGFEQQPRRDFDKVLDRALRQGSALGGLAPEGEFISRYLSA